MRIGWKGEWNGMCGRCKIIFILRPPNFQVYKTLFHFIGHVEWELFGGKSRSSILRRFHYKCNLYFAGEKFQCWKFVCHNGLGGIVKNCQFYASTCFESLSDCRIMNQNHKIDIIQNPSPPITSLSRRNLCAVRCLMGRRTSGVRWFRKIFLRFDTTTWVRQAFDGIERYASSDSLQHTMRLMQVWVGDNLLHGMQL